MQIFNEKEHVGQEEIQNVQCEEKGAPGKGVLEPSPEFKEIKCLKKSLILNGMKGVVTSRQDLAY